jgi:hypothetical protein
VAELADALASGASGRKVVEVRVLSWAPHTPTQRDSRLLRGRDRSDLILNALIQRSPEESSAHIC